jgi:hypothetical protein
MTHESIVLLFKDVAKSLADNVKFGYGAFEDFNSIRSKSYPYVWVYPLKGSFPVGEAKLQSLVEWEVEIAFLDADNPRGAEKDTADTWDKSFDLMERFVHKLDEFLLNPDDINEIQTDRISVTRTRFEAGRKATGDALSGWNLELDITTTSDFEYCSIYDD